MYIEIPKLKRCCFCLSLRYGIITCGYISLIVNLLLLMMTSLRQFGRYDGTCWYPRYNSTAYITGSYHGIFNSAHESVGIALYSVDVAFNVLLLVATHLKKIRLLRLYLYYGVVVALATFALYFATTEYIDSKQYFAKVALLFCGLVLRGYFLLMVWSQIEKLRDGKEVYCVNPDADELRKNHYDNILREAF